MFQGEMWGSKLDTKFRQNKVLLKKIRDNFFCPWNEGDLLTKPFWEKQIKRSSYSRRKINSSSEN